MSGLSTEPSFQPSFCGLNLSVVFAGWLRTHTRESQRVFQSICSLVRNPCQCQGVVAACFSSLAPFSVSHHFRAASLIKANPRAFCVLLLFYSLSALIPRRPKHCYLLLPGLSLGGEGCDDSVAYILMCALLSGIAFQVRS